ncbi:MAG: hypothetical protein HKN23_05630 [Verrucomicrobiales bacterium]|nr:hypothetical protein [Verrucomicrobiales bacterium]
MSLKRIVWRGLILLATFCLLVAIYVAVRIAPVAQLQNSISRPLEIYFNYHSSDKSKPKLINTDLDEKLGKVAVEWSSIRRNQGAPEWESLPGNYHERLRAPFRGPITEILVNYPGTYGSDAGAALSKFTSLQKLELTGDRLDTQSPEDLRKVMSAIASLPELRELRVEFAFADELSVLEPLRDCSSLEVLIIQGTFGISEAEFAEVIADIETLKMVEFRHFHRYKTFSFAHLPELLPDLEFVFEE